MVSLPSWASSLAPRTPGEQTMVMRPVDDLPSLDGLPEHRLEYIKQLATLCRDEIRQLTLAVGAALVVAAVLVSIALPGDLAGLAGALRFVLLLGVVSLGMGAVQLFRYTRALHLTRMSIARCIPALDAWRARELWVGEDGLWHQHGRTYRQGLIALGIGLGLQLIVLAGALLTA